MGLTLSIANNVNNPSPPSHDWFGFTSESNLQRVGEQAPSPSWKIKITYAAAQHKCQTLIHQIKLNTVFPFTLRVYPTLLCTVLYSYTRWVEHLLLFFSYIKLIDLWSTTNLERLNTTGTASHSFSITASLVAPSERRLDCHVHDAPALQPAQHNLTFHAHLLMNSFWPAMHAYRVSSEYTGISKLH